MIATDIRTGHCLKDNEGMLLMVTGHETLEGKRGPVVRIYFDRLTKYDFSTVPANEDVEVFNVMGEAL